MPQTAIKKSDLKDRKIILHNKRQLNFHLNGTIHKIDLTIKIKTSPTAGLRHAVGKFSNGKVFYILAKRSFEISGGNFARTTKARVDDYRSRHRNAKANKSLILLKNVKQGRFLH